MEWLPGEEFDPPNNEDDTNSASWEVRRHREEERRAGKGGGASPNKELEKAKLKSDKARVYAQRCHYLEKKPKRR